MDFVTKDISPETLCDACNQPLAKNGQPPFYFRFCVDCGLTVCEQCMPVMFTQNQIHVCDVCLDWRFNLAQGKVSLAQFKERMQKVFDRSKP